MCLLALALTFVPSMVTRPHFHRSHFQRHLQDLLEQSLQRPNVDLAEVRDRSEVRFVARRQYLEWDVLLA